MTLEGGQAGVVSSYGARTRVRAVRVVGTTTTAVLASGPVENPGRIDAEDVYIANVSGRGLGAHLWGFIRAARVHVTPETRRWRRT